MSQTPDVLDFNSLSKSAIHETLQAYKLGITSDEALTIQNTLLKRPPSVAECVLWSIQGSEHCSYKSTRKHLKNFVTDGPHVILGPREDAGIVAVATDHQGLRYGIVVSHESHNHPSQIVPYEGAATGVGGNVRDVCCMGAEVIAVADSLRFGDIERAKTHWLHQGVVSGIAGYGNPLGIPNLAGDTYYDEAYNDNCLVTVVTLGVVREDHVIHSYAPKDADQSIYILVGKPTDNSGFGGAAFASTTLHEEQKEQNKGAVQEPNAFLQRHLIKANTALFKLLQEQNLIHRVGFKDLGAGGIACAAVELAEASGYGAEVHLDTVPTSLSQLQPAVILCSETQERFMWVVPPDLVDMILHHYNVTFALPQISQGAQATVIGHIRTDGRFVVKHKGHDIVNALAVDVTKGILYDRPYAHEPKTYVEPTLAAPTNWNDLLLRMLAHENIASRAPIYESYDKQVQGRTIIEAGWADAGVMAPFNEDKYPEEIRQTGVALSLDQNPRYNKIDAYWGAVGATPISISDCLCFGNPEKPEQMAEFVDAVRGIADACAAVSLKDHPDHTLPVISGNVSLYNESANGAIPASPMIGCLGTMPNVKKAITYAFKRPHAYIVMLGERLDECGGSLYYQLHGHLGANVPQPQLTQFSQQIHAIHEAIQLSLISAAHDISDGGIAVALAEMTFKNKMGLNVNVPGALSVEKRLFSETGGFVLEVPREHWAALQQLFARYEVRAHVIGETTQTGDIQINDVIHVAVNDAYQVFENGLRERLL
jgi:phosphoribosylformylglycinamidine synthase